jgi:hypothetical protein
MFRKVIPTIILLISLSALSSNAATCVTLGTQFWNLAWGWGSSHYCMGGVWGNWDTTLIKQLQIYHVLRFMDWQSVNYTTAGNWANRTQKSAGCVQCNDQNKPIAYEWQIDIVNKVPGCGYWVCVPALCDSSYATNLAQLVYSLLAPGRRVYLQYANETWWEPASVNVVTAAGQVFLPTYATINGVTWGDPAFQSKFLGEVTLAAKMWHWFRKAWNTAGGDTTKVLRVLAGAAWANGADARYMLEALSVTQINPYKEKCDMFACADYFNAGNPTGVENTIRSYYNYCSVKGVALSCYEGGPSGTCTPTAMTSNLTMLNKYFNGPYNQYTHSGGQWGSVQNGYYSSHVSWAASSTCNPTPVQEPYRVVAPENPSSQTVISLLSSTTGLYGIDGRRVEPQSAKAGKTGCYIAVSPKSGYNLIMNMK